MTKPDHGSRQVTRRHAREAALQSLFAYDQNPDTTAVQTRRFVADELNFPKLEKFCMSLIEGVRANQAEIDALLGAAALHWSVKRMAAVDRAVLRLAIYELKFAPETPPKVVINEALELCKEYSGGESSSFVNGVLDRVHREIRRQAEATQGESAGEAPQEELSASARPPSEETPAEPPESPTPGSEESASG
jgi:N utilization substance protein B